jgi:hypothetical protein
MKNDYTIPDVLNERIFKNLLTFIQSESKKYIIQFNARDGVIDEEIERYSIDKLKTCIWENLFGKIQTISKIQYIKSFSKNDKLKYKLKKFRIKYLPILHAIFPRVFDEYSYQMKYNVSGTPSSQYCIIIGKLLHAKNNLKYSKNPNAINTIVTNKKIGELLYNRMLWEHKEISKGPGYQKIPRFIGRVLDMDVFIDESIETDTVFLVQTLHDDKSIKMLYDEKINIESAHIDLTLSVLSVKMSSHHSLDISKNAEDIMTKIIFNFS